MDQDTLIVLGSALAAALSFVAFALPFLNRSERKEQYRSIIEKKRRELFAQTKEGQKKRADDSSAVSARESMAAFYKVQQLAGEAAESIRDKMLQAGNRDPSAPLKFMVARAALPLVLGLLTMVFVSASDKELAGPVILLVVLGAAGLGYALPGIILKNQIIKRQEEIGLAFPDALDMMLICVQGGIGLEQTVHRIADEISEHSPKLAEELGILSAEMSMLNDRKAALQDFARRVGSGAGKSFATAMIQAEQYGTSVSQAMKVMAEELRDIRMQEAERKAMALPPKLTVPMIAFFLPSIFIVILGPVGVQVGNM
ncbi:MAG: type II secretion system F family protein [Alphaproteobacteria bacterium]|nr:type II secretion system F family protein [Alphaproteobacteria bacterium]